MADDEEEAKFSDPSASPPPKGRQFTAEVSSEEDMVATDDDREASSKARRALTSQGEEQGSSSSIRVSTDEEVREASPTARRPSRSDVHGRLHQLGEFSSLHRYYVYINKHKLNKGDEESDCKALAWCEAWKSLGYTYRRLLQMVAYYDAEVEEGKREAKELPTKLWGRLNGIRERLPEGTSVSYIVDRTVEHYQMVIMKRMKERKRIEQKEKYLQDQRSQQGHPTTVTLDPSSEVRSDVQVMTPPPPDKSQQEAQQQQGCPQQLQPPLVVAQPQEQLSLDAAVTQVQTEFHHFMFRKLGEVVAVAAGQASAVQTPQQHMAVTRAAVDKVLATVKTTQVHPSTLIAWYEIDLERNQGRIHYFPTLLGAYFAPVQHNLPPICSLKVLTAFIIQFAIQTSLKGRFKLPEAYESFENALRTLGIPPQQPLQEPSQQQYQQQQQQEHHPRTPPLEFREELAVEPESHRAPLFERKTSISSSSMSSHSCPPPDQHLVEHHHHPTASDRRREEEEVHPRKRRRGSEGEGSDRDDWSRRRRPSACYSSSEARLADTCRSSQKREEEEEEDDDHRPRRSERERRRRDRSDSGDRSKGRERRRRPAQPEKLDAKSFPFEHSDFGFHRLPGHPCSKTSPMTGELQDKLVVFCDLQVFGDGNLGADAFQIGACLERKDELGSVERSFFAAICDEHFSRSAMKTLGYSPHHDRRGGGDGAGEYKYNHPAEKKKLRCSSPNGAVRDLVSFVRRELGGTDFDGAVLVFAHPEVLGYFLRTAILAESKSLLQDLACVKGYLVLEDPVRRTYFRGLEEGPRGLDRIPRVPVDVAWRLAFGTSRRRLETADDRALALLKVYHELGRVGVDLNQECRRFNKSLIGDFDEFLQKIHELSDLRRFVKSKLEKERDTLLVSGVFDMFPCTFCQGRYDRLLNRCRAVSSTFVDILVACRVDKDWLQEEASVGDLNRLFSELKSRTLKRVARQAHQVEKQFDACLAATIDWVDRAGSVVRERKGGMDGRGPSRQHSLSSYGPKTPPESPFSGSSEDERRIEEKAPHVPGDLRDLCDYLEGKISSHKDDGSSGYVRSIAANMCELLGDAGHGAKSLAAQVQGLRKDDREWERAVDRLERILCKKERSHPPSWQGLSLEFLARHALEFSVGPVSKEEEKEKEGGLYGSRPGSRIFASAIDSFLSEQRQAVVAEETKKAAGGEETRLDPKELGLGNTKRKFSSSDLQLLVDFLEDFAEVSEDLVFFVDGHKQSDPMMRDTSSRLLILDTLKNLSKSKQTVVTVKQQLEESSAPEVTMRKINASVFGGGPAKRARKSGGYQASSDFDFYREVLSKLMELLADEGRRSRRRPCSSPGRKGSPCSSSGVKRRRRLGSHGEADLSDALNEDVSRDSPRKRRSRTTREKGGLTPRDVMQSFQDYIGAVNEEYRRLRKCVTERRTLHSYVYFAAEVRRACAGDSVACARVANDLMEHLGAAGVSEGAVGAAVRELRGSAGREERFKKECRAVVMDRLKFSELADLPESCRSVYGVLSSVVVRYFEEGEGDYRVPLSTAVRALELPQDDTNGLQELQDYITRSLATVLKNMVEEDGEIFGVFFQAMNLDPVAKLAAQWTEEVLESGFLLFGAVSSFLDGTFNRDFKFLLENNAPKGSSIAKPSISQLVCRLSAYWIERTVLLRDLDHFPANAVKTMKDQLVVLLRTTDLAPAADRDKLVVTWRIPTYLSNFISDVLLKLNKPVLLDDDAAQLVDFKPVKVDPALEPPRSPKSPVLEPPESKSVKEEIKEENLDPSEGAEEPFIDVPGFAVAGTVVTVKAGSSVTVKLCLCGNPRLRRGTRLEVLPIEDTQMKLKIEVRVPDDSKLLGGFQLLANLVNSGADDIIVPPGEKLARVRVKNREEAGVLLPLLPSEQRYMCVLRRYCNMFGVRGLEEEELDESVRGATGGRVCLGMGFDLWLPRTAKLNLSASNPLCRAGGKANGAKPRLYTVGSVVHYLKACHPEEAGGDLGDDSAGSGRYAAYMESCLRRGEEIVEFRDGRRIADYFFGRVRRVWKWNERPSGEDADTTSEGEGEESESRATDVGLASGVIEDPSAFPLIAKQCVHFSEELGQAIASIEDKVGQDVPAERRRPEACRRLERLLRGLSGAGVSLDRISREGATAQRADYENAVMARVVEHYRREPEVFGDLAPLRGMEALGAMRQPSRARHVDSVIALISLIPAGTEGPNMELRAQALSLALKSEDARQEEAQAPQGEENQAKIKRVQREAEVDREKVAWLKEAMSDLPAYLEAGLAKDFDHKERWAEGKEEELNLYLAASERIMAFIITARRGDDEEVMADARSRYLPEFVLDCPVLAKLCMAADWAMREQCQLLRSAKAVKVTAEAAGEELRSAMAEVPGLVVAVRHAGANPASALCLRDLCADPYVSHLGQCRAALSLTVSALCAKVLAARREARERRRRLSWKRRKEEWVRLEKKAREKEKRRGPSPTTLQEGQWDRECGEKIRSTGLHRLLPDLRDHLKRMLSLPASEANEAARRAAEALADACVSYEMLRETFLESGSGEDDMERMQDLLRSSQLEAPEPITVELLHLAVFRHFDWNYPKPQPECRLSKEEPETSGEDDKGAAESQSQSGEESVELPSGDEESEDLPPDTMSDISDVVDELLDDDPEEWFNKLVRDGLPLDQTPVPRSLWTGLGTPEAKKNPADVSERSYKQDGRKSLLQLQGLAIKGEEYRHLGVLYEQVLLRHLAWPKERASLASAKCVEAWLLAGISFQGLEEVCSSAVQVRRCLAEFRDKFTSMFGAVFCFSDPLVDVQRLLQLTLLFFAAGVLVKRSMASKRGNKSGRTFASVKGGAVAAAMAGESDTRELEELFDCLAPKLSKSWSPATLGILYTSFLKSTKGVAEMEANIAFQSALLSSLEIDEPILETTLLKETLTISRNTKLRDENKPEAAESGEKDIEDGEVLSDEGQKSEGEEEDDEVVELYENEEFGFCGAVTSTGDQDYHARNVSIRTKRFEPVVATPACQDSTYQPVFDCLFADAYARGMALQANWPEVSRRVAEELILCWKSAGFHGLDDILGRLEKALKERKASGNMARSKVFSYLLGCLREKSDILPPLVQMAFLARDTLKACDKILWERAASTKVKDTPEVEGISDEELLAPEDEETNPGVEKTEPISDAEMEFDDPKASEELDEMDLEALKRKREELEAAMANSGGSEDEEQTGESGSPEDQADQGEGKEETADFQKVATESEVEDKRETAEKDAKRLKLSPEMSPPGRGRGEEDKSKLSTLFSFVKAFLVVDRPSSDLASLDLASLVFDKRAVSRLTGLVDTRVEELSDEKAARQGYSDRLCSLQPLSESLMERMRRAFAADAENDDEADDPVVERNCHALSGAVAKVAAASGATMGGGLDKDAIKESLRWASGEEEEEDELDRLAGSVAAVLVEYMMDADV